MPGTPLVWALTLAVATPPGAAELKPATAAAFEKYVRLTEQRMDAELGPQARFLWIDQLDGQARTDRMARLRRGELVIERLRTRKGRDEIDVPDGMIHHWVGVVFLPGVKVDAAVSLLQDYDRHARIFAPNVAASKTLEKNGDRYRVFLRFYMKKVIAVTMNTEHAATFTRAAPDRAWSRIHSTRISEVADAGTPKERELPPGRDQGFMWRLNTYWRFLERDGGTYVQCESLTLSRAVPFGLGWLIGPFVTSVPKDSLTFTLEKTRAALAAPSPLLHEDGARVEQREAGALRVLHGLRSRLHGDRREVAPLARGVDQPVAQDRGLHALAPVLRQRRRAGELRQARVEPGRPSAREHAVAVRDVSNGAFNLGLIPVRAL